ncbi:hypothetical protein RJ641_002986 [Dillenia turbinata]|uniref:CCHC-type domain-containing protein n=1 Tax=Dillenia turbinata TaxID=194707 RepID=A0AAN8VA97_9MAGN
MSSSFCSSFRIWVPPQRAQKNVQLMIFLQSKRKNQISLFPCRFSSSSSSNSLSDNSISNPRQSQVGYDPSEELFGLGEDLEPRDGMPGAAQPRSWFGPNGQYIRELPCPSCRGRGYTPCTECGIERSRSDCSLCGGKGIMTCHQCSGDCVIWEESIDERPWEKAHSISPFKVKEDDEVDQMVINLDSEKKSKRVYQSPPPEVGLKISRSLKSLNAKTGLFSKRMKIIHRDPKLHAQRVAAIKKAKGTAAARKHASEALKAFFRDPENRRKRSIAMKGVKFYCKNCGREGHRKHFCPELDDRTKDRWFRCRLCGEKGHNRRTCPTSRSKNSKGLAPRPCRCGTCGEMGHNSRTCLQRSEGDPNKTRAPKRKYVCWVCREMGHNSRTCPRRAEGDPKKTKAPQRKKYVCQLCLEEGHNRRTCPRKSNALLNHN